MAHTTLLDLGMNMFVGDNDAQLVAGDLPAARTNFLGRAAMSMDDTDEEAMTSVPLTMPGQYAGGTLTVDITFAMASDNTNDIALDVFVEAITPGTDTLDITSASGWDSANSGTISLVGSTAGDALKLSIELTNKDGVVAGDMVRIGIRRDTDSANDDAVGDLYPLTVDFWETT